MKAIKWTNAGMWVITAAVTSWTAGDFTPDETGLSQGKIITRQLPAPTCRTYAGQVRGVIDAHVDSVWSVLGDYNRMHEYMPSFPVAFLADSRAVEIVGGQTRWDRGDLEEALAPCRIERLPGDTVYFYNVVDIPFPIPDRWFLLKVIRNPHTHTARWNLVAGNMIANDGSWELSPFRNDSTRTLAIYTTSSDSGIFLPQFVINIAFNCILPSIIKQVRRRMADNGAGTGRGIQ
jgi:hypothetical protein